MKTPICDFVKNYAEGRTARLHMPGHKGAAFLGCEGRDITEIAGADSLYEAEGIIAQSEQNAAALFGSAKTLYSTEGSSQCIRAMLCLAAKNAPAGEKPLVLAARNVHRTFVLACALLDMEVQWLWPEGGPKSLCSCPVSPTQLENSLQKAPRRPCAVYLTSPDYLGGVQDIRALADVAHAYGVPLLADNAHGAYLRFLSPSRHPLDLGADLCCDSAHKTLPVLTGGAYLHIGKNAPARFAAEARQAMALFGSTSPSYLILQSLDLANRYMAEGFAEKLARRNGELAALADRLEEKGWAVYRGEPLKLTVEAARCGWTGQELAEKLRRAGGECEHADRDHLVLMAGCENTPEELALLEKAFGGNDRPHREHLPFAGLTGEPRRACSIRQAVLSAAETLPVCEALGRTLASPTVSCPPAVPVLVSGEVIDGEAIRAFLANGIDTVDVIL